MLLECEFLFSEITDDAIDRLGADQIEKYNRWFFNGAQPTLSALRRLRHADPDSFEALIDYIREAPLFETLELDSGDFLLTHSGIGGFDPERPISDYSPSELLWHRPTPDERYFDDVMTVFGHTPTAHFGAPGRMFRTDTWVDIDTGAAAGGAPMLLRPLVSIRSWLPPRQRAPFRSGNSRTSCLQPPEDVRQAENLSDIWKKFRVWLRSAAFRRADRAFPDG
jgi:serine/threonine protein phosphatase 1